MFDCLRSRTLTTAMGEVAYVTNDLGNVNPARPPLFFWHGFGGGSSRYEWSAVYLAFSAEYPLFALDLPGWGASEHRDQPYTVAAYVDHLLECLGQLTAEPAVVITSSLTAAFAIQGAIAHPQRFRGLILTCPTGLSDFGQDYRQTPLAQIARQSYVDIAFYRLGVANSLSVQSFMANQQFARPSRISPEMVATYTQVAQSAGAEFAALAFVRGDLCCDLSRFLPHLTVPTYIVWGEQAKLPPVAVGQRLALLNPEAIRAFDVMPEVGLTPQLECPAVMIGWIDRYLGQLLASP
ncbi:alpha/beta hydrolase [Thermosynechococcus sp. JY1334]|uniref:alpha/beta fold hydrolase n=1 Tax=unclassified Thermosynechococcus TaxID=2622553 RepID=UPI00267104FD|nr:MULTISPECIES: alpha/beta hydrolase [unclassified Thermosynechococcus]MDR7896828.1 alpha/beta hydrolase [Thermosynechococcus sp. JY1332]MDR7904225.1 alpha/beta hydrolase [Thermosynechococcus sp. JY1334]MDR7992059.1 alpha/beta hydrolase [Thermosynechococcus sp. TG252]WKT86477.1 alpha/beta hydrolase [Thermosynechococcus sp. JY1339]WNC55422.1 alpha/beta hydrolase [Thermosynechococcus sp. JY1331]